MRRPAAAGPARRPAASPPPRSRRPAGRSPPADIAHAAPSAAPAAAAARHAPGQQRAGGHVEEAQQAAEHDREHGDPGRADDLRQPAEQHRDDRGGGQRALPGAQRREHEPAQQDLAGHHGQHATGQRGGDQRRAGRDRLAHGQVVELADRRARVQLGRHLERAGEVAERAPRGGERRQDDGGAGGQEHGAQRRVGRAQAELLGAHRPRERSPRGSRATTMPADVTTAESRASTAVARSTCAIAATAAATSGPRVATSDRADRARRRRPAAARRGRGRRTARASAVHPERVDDGRGVQRLPVALAARRR